MTVSRWLVLGFIILGLLGTPRPAAALVDPSLQPADLLERHAIVLVLNVTTIDEETRTITLDVVDRPKGKFEPKQVSMNVDDDGPLEAFATVIAPGQTLVAFLGAKHRGAAEVLIYLADGHWGKALPDKEGKGQWQWTQSMDPSGESNMFGTFNGHGQRLAEMMHDAAGGRAFFPARPFVRFAEDQNVATLSSPALGLALVDIDGDGRLDIVAVTAKTTHILKQTKPGVYEQVTMGTELEEVGGASVDVADVNADGKPDLLVGGVLLIQNDTGFVRSDALPANAAQNVKNASFVDINADGWPDVLVSRVGQGLAIYLHTGGKDATFLDATEQSGMAQIPQVQTGNGQVMTGDWDNDGRVDLFYSSGHGLLLRQEKEGFTPVPSRLRFDFTTQGKDEGLTGGGCMAPLWRADSTDLIFASQANVNFIINEQGKLLDAGVYGNEITEGGNGLSSVLAEDLNADGRVDVYAINVGGSANVFYTNRGYGSFMTPHKYDTKLFPGRAHTGGAISAVAGDLDGDGANDLVLGLADGSVVIMRNETLASRGKTSKPTLQQRILDETSILTVNVTGPLGVTGAAVTLLDVAGKVVARRIIAGQDMPGSRGPDAVNLAVRDPGTYSVEVTWTDGLKRAWPVDLSKPSQHLVVGAGRDQK